MVLYLAIAGPAICDKKMFYSPPKANTMTFFDANWPWI